MSGDSPCRSVWRFIDASCLAGPMLAILFLSAVPAKAQLSGHLAKATSGTGGFGFAVAVADFDGDGYDDLAGGAPDSNDGSVQVFYGAADGTWRSTRYIANPSPTLDDRFGHALAAGDFNDDGYDDLAVGAPHWDKQSGSINNAGAVHVLYGSATGLTTTGADLWHQDVSGISGACEGYDRFGASLASGDFDNDGYDDLAIGVPDEEVSSQANTGMINVLYGDSGGLSTTGQQGWHQDTTGVSGSPEPNDLFGFSLAAGDIDNDGHDDLAIGSPGEDIDIYDSAGRVVVLYGSSAGITATGHQSWHQDTAGIDDFAEAQDQFGVAVAIGDFNGDSFGDLAVGAPGESLDVSQTGVVHVLPGTSSGLSSNDLFLWQGWGAIPDDDEANDHFGASLTLVTSTTTVMTTLPSEPRMRISLDGGTPERSPWSTVLRR